MKYDNLDIFCRTDKLSMSTRSTLENCLEKYGMVFDSCISMCSPSACKRQIDPLQSCIEAKCAGAGRNHYGSCIFNHCIVGMRLKNFKKRSWNNVMQTCIEFHCRQRIPGSVQYTICVHSNCSKIAYGKRWQHLGHYMIFISIQKNYTTGKTGFFSIKLLCRISMVVKKSVK